MHFNKILFIVNSCEKENSSQGQKLIDEIKNKVYSNILGI